MLMVCTNCKNKMKVPDEAAGKKTKCPSCGTVLRIPEAPAAAAPAAPPKPAPKPAPPPPSEPEEVVEEDVTEVVEEIAPISKGPPPVSAKKRPPIDEDDEEEDRPRRKARRDADEDDEEEERPRKKARRRDEDDEDDDLDISRKRRRRLAPHRGVMLLILGILSIPCCGIILGLITSNMAANDLKAMDAGTMDPAGRGLTQTARILGIIGAILWVASVIFRVVMMFVGNNVRF